MAFLKRFAKRGNPAHLSIQEWMQIEAGSACRREKSSHQRPTLGPFESISVEQTQRPREAPWRPFYETFREKLYYRIPAANKETPAWW